MKFNVHPEALTIISPKNGNLQRLILAKNRNLLSGDVVFIITRYVSTHFFIEIRFEVKEATIR